MSVHHSAYIVQTVRNSTVTFTDCTGQYSPVDLCAIIHYSAACKCYAKKSKVIKKAFPLATSVF